MIKISVPNDDSVALFHFGKSLIDMSSELEGSPGWVVIARGEYDDLKALQRLKQATEDLMQAAPAMLQENNVDGSIEVHGKRKEAEVDTTLQQVESLADKFNVLKISEQYETHPDTDSTGTPWDERIHSASKALNADGTWRLRRKPKDMDEAEWSAYLRSVADELVSEPHGPDADNREQEALDAIRKAADDLNNGVPVAEAVAPLAQFEPSVTPEGDDFHTDAGVVTERQVASFPPPPPVPQVLTPVQEAKVAEVVAQATMTFPQVMAFLTERHGRITSAQVDQIIADMGLEKITDLNTQPEHTGPFIARVKALLGE